MLYSLLALLHSMSLDINFIAVLAASVAAFLVGALWYGPLFGKQWRMLMGINDQKMGGKLTMAQALSGGFVATVVMVFILANFLPLHPALTIGIALTRAFLLWLGFIATVLLNSVFYEGKPFKLYIINASHYLVALLVAAALFAWWPW